MAEDRDDPRRSTRRIGVAWLALLALLAVTLAAAWVPLGPGNVAVSLGAAVAKSAIVAWFFMHLRHAGTLARIAAVCGLPLLVLLVGLSGVDYATREVVPAAVQVPRQLPAMFDRGQVGTDKQGQR